MLPLRLSFLTTRTMPVAIVLVACLAIASCSASMDPNNLPKPLNDSNVISVTLPDVAVNSETK